MTPLTELRGLTWDHPRGYAGLEAATAAYLRAEPGVAITWDRQPLAGFEASPIEHLAEAYDLIVLDHPFMGDAWKSGCLVDLDQHRQVLDLDALRADVMGPSFDIYRYGGLWAAPLDAATQVSVFRPDRIEQAPPTLEDVRALAREERLAIALHGPHSVLTWFSIYSNLGEPPDGDGEELLEPSRAVDALELLREIYSFCPRECVDWNSIAALDAMSVRDDLSYCPYIYAFASYSRAVPPRRNLRFADIPALIPGSAARGAMLGGTGLAISRRCMNLDQALRLVAYLTRASTQESMAEYGGQPVRRSVWASARLAHAFDGFYRNTARTMDLSAVRPRYPGYIPLQAEAGRLTERHLREGGAPRDLIDRINAMHRKIRLNTRSVVA